MKQNIKTIIVGIPWAKRLYLTARQWCARISFQLARPRLNNQVIRQGSPECFTGMPLRIDWHVTTHCNYRCSYCFNAGNEYKKVFCTLEQAETAIKHIASANRPAYQVNLIGGEPTTHPHLAEIITLLCQYLGNRLEQLEITTNGSFSERQMDAILKAGELINVKLIISIHLEYMKVERVVELVKRFSPTTRLQLALMLHPELVDKAMSMADALCDLRRDYHFMMYPSMLREGPAFDRFDGRYTQNHLDCADTIRERFAKASAEGPEDAIKRKPNFGWQFLLERKENDSIARHERLSVSELKDLTGNVFTGVTCCAGTSIVDIAIDGSVKGMVCALDHATCNIYKENPFLRKDWIHGVFCSKPMCGCSVNHRIPKFGSHADAQKFIAGKRLEQKQLLELQDGVNSFQRNKTN